VRLNGYEWARPETDGVERDETVAIIKGVAEGTVSQEELGEWIRGCLVETGDDNEG